MCIRDRIIAVHCTYDPESKGGETPDGRKVKGTLHWVSAENCIDFTANLYDRLFLAENPSDESGVTEFTENLNPDSIQVLRGCKLDGSFKAVRPGDTFQFMRQPIAFITLYFSKSLSYSLSYPLPASIWITTK